MLVRPDILHLVGLGQLRDRRRGMVRLFVSTICQHCNTKSLSVSTLTLQVTISQHYNTISQHYNTVSQHLNVCSQHYFSIGQHNKSRDRTFSILSGSVSSDTADALWSAWRGESGVQCVWAADAFVKTRRRR